MGSEVSEVPASAHGGDEPPSSIPAGIPEPIRWAMVGFVLTGLFIFFGAPLLKPDVSPGYAPTSRAEVLPDGTFRITLDVQNREAWVPLDLSMGRVVDASKPSDLLVRRYKIQAPQGAADLDQTDLLAGEISETAQWEADIAVDGQPQNPAMARWYHYGWQSHLLQPKDSVYGVRLHGGGAALLQIESYYCHPEGSGCMTLRYRLQR